MSRTENISRVGAYSVVSPDYLGSLALRLRILQPYVPLRN